jgi:hypothetical protein
MTTQEWWDSKKEARARKRELLNTEWQLRLLDAEASGQVPDDVIDFSRYLEIDPTDGSRLAILQIQRVLADWSDHYELKEILDSNSELTMSTHGRAGVYMIVEIAGTPKLRSINTRYIGESSSLRTRLLTYATGRSGTPVEKVVEEHLATCSKHERRIYEQLSPAEQQAWRRSWMGKRDFRVTFACTQDKLQAQMLEKAMIRLYRQAYRTNDLWNRINYVNTPPFAVKVVA